VGLREYEAMLILPAEADESVVATAVDRIAKSGGEVTKTDRWGRRRFAFEIDHQTEGYYVVVQFTADPGRQVEMERTLTLADEIIRFKVLVRPPVKPKKPDRRREASEAAAADEQKEASPAPA
jgi:small subunit ribosomal protein S6